MLQPLLAGTGVRLVSVNKKNLETTITQLAAGNNITTAWIMTFSYIIPSSLLTALPGGFINFHYGLLPKYRGSNPVLAEMLQFEKEGGITVHVVDENIDTGPVILQQKIVIEDFDTFGMHLQKLGALGAALALEILKRYQADAIPHAIPQDESKASYFKKPTASDLMINWEKLNSVQVIRVINACNPWNKGAGAIINNQVICLTDAELTEDIIPEDHPPGTIVAIDSKEGLKVICSDKRIIRVNIIYTPAGLFAGHKLAAFGIKLKDRFS
jgi:methionyl-tRNA formyltransferase